MVICNNNIHTEALRKLNLGRCGNTAIYRNQQGCTVFCYARYRLLVYSVAFVNAVRYIIVDICTEAPKNVHKNAYGRDPVYIIVSVHNDSLVFFYPTGYSLHCLVYIFEKVRIFKIRKISP